MNPFCEVCGKKNLKEYRDVLSKVSIKGKIVVGFLRHCKKCLKRRFENARKSNSRTY